MKRLKILTLVALLLACITFAIKHHRPQTITTGKGLVVDRAWLTFNRYPLTPKADIRPADQTFLTYPEWFLVFSPAEQSVHFKDHTSTTFPYFAHVQQMWGGYGVVNDQIKGNYPFNTGYHVMITVIAGSTTVEYGIKAIYEWIIGRMTDTREAKDMVAEDRFNARYTESYLRFIEKLPWYQYDFAHQLNTLWRNEPLYGDHLIRKLERRYYLTTELLVKCAYGWLIGVASGSVYDTASLKTTVITERMPTAVDSMISDIKPLPNGGYMARLPRYAAFANAINELYVQEAGIKEIAGNTGAIMISVLGDDITQNYKDTRIIFKQPIAITQGKLFRTVLVTPVANLGKLIGQLKYDDQVIEHVYDY